MSPPGWGFRSCWHLVRPWIRLACYQMYLQTETSCGQVWYYFGSVWHFGQTSGQVDIWSDLWVRIHLVRCTPQIKTSCGQVWYYFGSVWNLSYLQVRVTFGQIYPPSRDIWWKSVKILQVSLVLAAMVIPAPLMYIKVVAVKTACQLVGLLYKRPFTLKGNYLVLLMYSDWLSLFRNLHLCDIDPWRRCYSTYTDLQMVPCAQE